MANENEVVEETMEAVTTFEEFADIGLPHWTHEGWMPER